MGNCITTTNANENQDTETSPTSGPRPTAAGQIRKNHPLSNETIRWKSDVPLTDGQLRSKRDEFWETAKFFDGKIEIWDALRAATAAAEILDFELSQAILDGANISVPNGYLTECYDELGTQYKVPIYCLSKPINIVEDNGRDSPASFSEPIEVGNEIVLKLRLSSNASSDLKLSVYSKDTIGQCKKKLQAQENVDAFSQRWFYGGKLLSDKIHIEDAKIQPGWVIQVIVNTEKINPSIRS